MDQLITNDICLNILKQCSPDDNNLTVINKTIKKFSEETKGFMGEHFSLEIQANNQKTYMFFVKSKPLLLPSFEEYINELGIFTKETNLFKTLLEILRKFSSTIWSPKCYYIVDNDVIIMENLLRKGYKIYNNREYFNYNQVKAFIQTLAVFHGTSIIYEELTMRNTNLKHFKIPDKYANLLTESAYYNEEGHIRRKWLISNTEAFITAAKQLDNFKPEYEQPLRDKFMHLPDLMKTATKYREVVNHGDLWCNNIMFSDQNNNDELHCILVDFQLCRYSSPAHDFMLALFTTTDHEFRSKYYTHVLDMYYDVLSDELKAYSLDINELYPKHDYLHSCDEYRVIGLLKAALYTVHVFYRSEDIDYMLADADNFFKFTLGDKNDFVLNIFKNDEHIRERVQDIFNNIVKYVL